ncbi:hypothetical protein [Halorarum halobium]|uniref:hypothetical protein n=1 Tax=Halorarum halobium TaxID=3075121 RepID=UPI0028A6B831|nr:hypothetical protein [Halobaculum sp. XH14]
MRPDHLNTDDALLVSRRGPKTDGSVLVSLAVTLAVVFGVLAASAPAVAAAAVVLVAAGFLLAEVRRRARAGVGRRRRRLCVPKTSVCVTV